MNNEEFVDSLRLHVKEAGVDDVITKLKSPPGRRIPPKMQMMSTWYNSLSEENAKTVNAVIELTAHEILFGVLAVLDGARIIDTENGKFELIYEAKDGRVMLNNPSEIGLHDLLNSSD